MADLEIVENVLGPCRLPYELLEDSFKTDGNYTKATLVYTYSNGQKIELDMYMLNEESETEDEFKFIPKS